MYEIQYGRRFLRGLNIALYKCHLKSKVSNLQLWKLYNWIHWSQKCILGQKDCDYIFPSLQYIGRSRVVFMVAILKIALLMAAIFNSLGKYQIYSLKSYLIAFIDLKNVYLDTKILIIPFLFSKVLRKVVFMVAILNIALLMAAIFNFLWKYQIYSCKSYLIEFFDLKNIYLDTKIVIIPFLASKILREVAFMAAILNFAFLRP